VNRRATNRPAVNRRDVPAQVRAWVAARLAVLDPVLLALIVVLAVIGLVTLISAAADNPVRVNDQLRNYAIAAAATLLCASLSPQALMRIAVPSYVIGLVLLIAVAIFGVSVKGARRWLDLAVSRVQPSEILKLAVPLMLAWYFHRREGVLRGLDFAVATLLVLVPVALIALQPDLGTALLVLGAGLFVIFFAGLPWRWIGVFLLTGMSALPIAWSLMRDYQRSRILTLFDPASDPLGKGFHTLQAMIAIGSGGVFGKGWMKGTQAHLEFIPERTTDFIFAVFSEEFGLVGNLVLLVLFIALIGRALEIAGSATTRFSRLLAAAIAMIIFTYVFVNMGMVSGILPVVGVPLPFVSYGGTALLTLGMACGMLMSIHRTRKLVHT
jgi:rod shape determining protein RodA